MGGGILYLVITGDDDMVENVSMEGRISSSDHEMMIEINAIPDLSTAMISVGPTMYVKSM